MSRLPVVAALVIALGALGAGAQEDSLSRGWSIQPHGRAWSEFYAPHDPAVFWEFGLDLTMWYQNPSPFEPFMYLEMKTQAGYNYSETEGGPRTPVDLLHQIWQQGIGVAWNMSTPVYLFGYRDCNHQLDKGGFEPVLATTFMLAAGTLPPFRKDITQAIPDSVRYAIRWMAGAGPSPTIAAKSMWHSNSKITAEGWVRALAVYRTWSHGRVDIYLDWLTQSSDLRPRFRHVVETQIGVTLLTPPGSWRFYAGRRWRDTRELWPVDQRTEFGLEFLF